MTRILKLTVLSLFLIAPAFAADEEGGEGEDRRVVYKSTTEIDFEGLDVSGELVKPSSAMVIDRKKASFNPLIKLRSDFNEEMEQSVDEVK
jgi:hypothetical protein